MVTLYFQCVTRATNVYGISSHNAIWDSFCEMFCKAAGLITTRIEAVEMLKQNNIDDTKNRRVDAICDNFLPGIPMAFDHSIADPRQSGLSVKPIFG